MFKCVVSYKTKNNKAYLQKYIVDYLLRKKWWKELTEKIEANEEEQEKITALREKRNADFMAEADEVKQALAALQAAMKVLTDATIKD